MKTKIIFRKNNQVLHEVQTNHDTDLTQEALFHFAVKNEINKTPSLKGIYPKESYGFYKFQETWEESTKTVFIDEVR